jgi:quercetin dioxygenase-like cupin family protein
MKRSVAVGALLGGLFAFTPVALDVRLQPPHLMVTPSELAWTDAPAALPPGAKFAVIEGPLDASVPFTFRIKFPPDYKIPAHRHPAIEHVTVMSGTFHMGTGDRLDTSRTTALPSGSVAIMQPRTPHFAWTKEETVVQVHGVGPWAINYVNPNDDPRKKKS